MLLLGQTGRLLVGYRQAAVITGWRMSAGNSTLGKLDTAVSAQVKSMDEFWCTAPSFTLALWMGRAWWVWDIATPDSPLVVGGNVVLSVVGHPEAHEYLKGIEEVA